MFKRQACPLSTPQNPFQIKPQPDRKALSGKPPAPCASSKPRVCNNKPLLKSCQLAILLSCLLLLGACATKHAPAQPDTTEKTGRAIQPDLRRLIAEVEKDHGPIAANRIRYWAKLIQENRHQLDLQKLQQTNQFFNSARFVTDQEVWLSDDYWATPVEFLIKDAGDCEDFAIAKYVTLDLMGIDIDKMRITYVKAQSLNQPHMVLSYYAHPSDMPLILDNITPLILPGDQREDLTPVYSFNGNTLWLARSRNVQVPSGDAQQLGLWQQLIERMQRELPPVPR